MSEFTKKTAVKTSKPNKEGNECRIQKSLFKVQYRLAKLPSTT